MSKNTVKVEACWGGGTNNYFRLIFPCGHRETVRGSTWSRKLAQEALNIAEHVYHMNRGRVRFKHV